jgi:hypothetical protein
VHGVGGEIARTSERQSIPVIQAHHRFERFPALSLGQHALEHGAERLRGDRIASRTHGRVARDTLDAVDGVQMALCPLLVKGEARGRFAGKQGEGGHEGIGSRHIRIGSTIIGDVVKAGVHQPQARIGGERFPSVGGNVRQENPCHEHVTAFT